MSLLNKEVLDLYETLGAHEVIEHLISGVDDFFFFHKQNLMFATQIATNTHY